MSSNNIKQLHKNIMIFSKGTIKGDLYELCEAVVRVLHNFGLQCK